MIKDIFILIGLLLIVVGSIVLAFIGIMFAFNSGIEAGIGAIAFFMASLGFLLLSTIEQ